MSAAAAEDGLSLEEQLEIRSSAVVHMETCVTLTDDVARKWGFEGDLLPDGSKRELQANTLQIRTEKAIEWCRRRGLPVRIIVVKGRRSGESTFWAKFVDLECRNQKTKALQLADVFKRSDEIFSITRQFAESDQFPWGFAAEAKAALIEYGNGSQVVKETAMDPRAGRGGGYRIIHLSEVAHFPSDGVRDAEVLMSALLPTVPKTPETVIGAESTGNGRQGWFFKTWCKARWPVHDPAIDPADADANYFERYSSGTAETPGGEVADDEGLWIRVFAAWFEIPRNAWPVAEQEAARIMGRLSPREKAGVAKYGWTAAQIKWRRVTITSDFSGNEKKFDQEYPEDPEKAFIASGTPAFNPSATAELSVMCAQAKPHWRCGVIEAAGLDADDILRGRWGDVGVTFRQTVEEEAWVNILELPKDGCSYIIPMDTASGSDITESNDLDRSSVLVIRDGYWQEMPDERKIWHRPRVVARLRRDVMEAPPTSKMTLYMLSLLCRLYGNPTFVPERNKGEWVIIGAQEAKLNVYVQQTFDRTQNKPTRSLGFYTTEDHRHTIIKELQSAVHGSGTNPEEGVIPDIEIEDPDIVSEMESFVLRKARYEAATGCWDDDVMCLAIGWFLRGQATRYRVRRKRRHVG